MVVLACSGLYIKEYINSEPCEEKEKYFDDDIVELGIQPQNPRKVQVEVYYETLCPDTRLFIRSQLYPAWDELEHIMDIHWKPYGKATHYENEGLGYMFQCQHGPTECMGNKVHACSIKHIKDDRKLTDYIHCMIEDNYDPKEVGQSCAQRHEVDWEPIHSCSNTKEGAELLALHGDDTRSLRPKMTFVPHIVMNGKTIQPQDALTNFKHILCSAYRGDRPDACIDII